MEKFDVIVIGAGPSGMTSALYASRAGLSVLVIDKGLAGGQMNNTAGIENYPGFKNIIGHKLGQRMYKSTMRFGAKYVYGKVKNIIHKDKHQNIVLTDLDKYMGKSLIIATGANPKHLNVKGERKLAGHGVSYCAVCDGNFFKNQPVTVVGGGDSALTEAIYLSHICSKVIILIRKSNPQAEQQIIQHVNNTKNIVFKYDTEVKAINGTNNVQSLKLFNNKSKTTSILPTKAIFIYIGMIPVSQFINNFQIKNKNGWIETNNKMQTVIPDIFATGDIRKNQLRQIATAIGTGAIAGNNVYKYLNK